MTALKVGDIVKSLDFHTTNNCYMVGKVVAIQSDGLFRARFIKRVWLGVEDTKFKTDYFTAPLQGQSTFDQEEAPRIIVIA